MMHWIGAYQNAGSCKLLSLLVSVALMGRSLLWWVVPCSQCCCCCCCHWSFIFLNILLWKAWGEIVAQQGWKMREKQRLEARNECVDGSRTTFYPCQRNWDRGTTRRRGKRSSEEYSFDGLAQNPANPHLIANEKQKCASACGSNFLRTSTSFYSSTKPFVVFAKLLLLYFFLARDWR